MNTRDISEIYCETDSDSDSATHVYFDDSDESTPSCSNSTWKSGLFKPKNWIFTSNPGINDEIELDGENSLDYFKYFIDDNFIKNLVDQTNLYQQLQSTNKNTPWLPTNLAEMNVFLAIAILIEITTNQG